ncbi:hypothetical protein TRFO_18863 [Tritrichomonas foetus]|uniref:RSE1/DDB1/CPSF1 C-terminal domain-containing protein n=1 Tax=Tritrichomonas foetus TaxID=1144522 RepID=A0A1J4KJX1_9EUKA|nr:hypothetical protein TRFO_18863 [Tritrichomonas foetus]|eukprot:OHT11607.1 hypothetical protein TRFO_18863 [Tritrichomonas foetus]
MSWRSFIHKTLRRSSYLLNTLEGCWLPHIQAAQFIFHYGTSFEIFVLNSTNTLELYYSQPLFCKVPFICSGPSINELDTFFALRDADILQLIYKESEGIFVKVRRINLPKLCRNPTFAIYKDKNLIVSATHGGICTINIEINQISTEKPTNCVLHTFPIASSYLLRIESGPAFSIYNLPDGSLVESNSIESVQYAFPYCDSYISFNNDLFTIHQIHDKNNSQNEELILRLPDINQSISPHNRVIDYATITTTSTCILTENGHLFQIYQDEFEYFATFEHSYRIFALTSSLLLISRHGLNHILYDVIEKVIIQEIQAISAVTNFTFHDNRFITLTDNSFIATQQGIKIQELSCFETDEQIYGLFSFNQLGKTFFSISYENRTDVLELNGDSLTQVIENPAIRTDVRTIGIASLFPNLLIQFFDNGFTFLSKNHRKDRILKNTKIVCYASTTKEFICILSDLTGKYGKLNDTKVKIIDIQFKISVTSIAFIEDTEYFVYGGNDSTIYLGNIHNKNELSQYVLSKVPSIPVSLKFIDKKKLAIGFEDGTMAVGEVDISSLLLRDTTLVQLGEKAVTLVEDFALSNKMYHLNVKNDTLNIAPINNKVTPEFIAPLQIGKYLMSSQNKIYAIALCGKELEMDDRHYHMENHSEKCLSCKNHIIIASNKVISKFNIENNQVKELFYFKNETFQFMTKFDQNRICVITQASSNPEKNGNYFHDKYGNSDSNEEEQYQIDIGDSESDSDRKFEIEMDKNNNKDQYSFIHNVRFINLIDDNITLSLQLPETINAICEFKDGILIGTGNSILFYKENNGKYQIVSRTSNIGTEIMFLIVNNEKVFVADKRISVLVLEYEESFQNFKIIGQEAIPRKILSICKYGDSITGSDIQGNIFSFDSLSKIVSDLSATSSMFQGCRKLNLKMCFNIGEIIVDIHSQKAQMNAILYSTVNGSFGAFLEKEPNNFSLRMDLEGKFLTLSLLQTVLERQLLSLSDIDHYAFRNAMYPSESVIDIDLINTYLQFSDNKKERIAQEVSKSLSARKVEIIIRNVNQIFNLVC